MHEIYLRPQENHTEQNGPKSWSLLRVESSEGARQYESEHIRMSGVNGNERRIRARDQEMSEERLKSHLCYHKG